MRECRFIVPGQPKTMKRPRKGKGGHFYVPRETIEAEQEVAWLAKGKGSFGDEFVFVSVEFRTSRRGKRAGDIDNSLKLVLDALQKSGTFNDDSQVRSLHARVIEVPVGDEQTEIVVRRLVDAPVWKL